MELDPVRRRTRRRRREGGEGGGELDPVKWTHKQIHHSRVVSPPFQRLSVCSGKRRENEQAMATAQDQRLREQGMQRRCWRETVEAIGERPTLLFAEREVEEHPTL
jgi:hypothetical protein